MCDRSIVQTDTGHNAAASAADENSYDTHEPYNWRPEQTEKKHDRGTERGR